MKVNELRIGNWVTGKAFNKIHNVRVDIYDLIQMQDIKVKKRITTQDVNIEYNPIPITEEIILNCGFQEYYGVYRIKIKQDQYIRGYIVNDGFNCCIDDRSCDIEGVVSINIGSYKHIHQLQNLYFILTGEELKITLK